MLWIGWRSFSYIRSFMKEMRKVVVNRHGIAIYRPYARAIKISVAQIPRRISSLEYASHYPEVRNKGYDHNIALGLSDGKRLYMTCSAEQLVNFRERLASYGIPMVEVEPTSLKLFV